MYTFLLRHSEYSSSHGWKLLPGEPEVLKTWQITLTVRICIKMFLLSWPLFLPFQLSSNPATAEVKQLINLSGAEGIPWMKRHHRHTVKDKLTFEDWYTLILILTTLSSRMHWAFDVWSECEWHYNFYSSSALLWIKLKKSIEKVSYHANVQLHTLVCKAYCFLIILESSSLLYLTWSPDRSLGCPSRCLTNDQYQ